MFKNKKILLTGSEGFVGRHFMQKLKGNDITEVDIVHANPIDARDFFRNDNTHYDLVIHLAAVVGGRATIEGAPLSVAVDLSIDSEAFQWAIRTKPKHFVYYSSSAAYPIELQRQFNHIGGTDMKPVDVELNTYRMKESDIDLNKIKNPDLTYGWSKLTGEMLAKYAHDEGVRVHIFRPFSGYGSDQALDYPFPSFVQRAKRQYKDFRIWGSGEQVRDWIHIDDIVDATMMAVTEDIQGPINLCSGRPTKFVELAEIMMKEAGYKGRVSPDSNMPTGVMYRVGDPTKMNTFYTPKISIEEGVRRALKN